MKIAQEVVQNCLILCFRIASVLFLLGYPLVKFAWRLITRPWLIGSIIQGVHLTLAPLRHLAIQVHDQPRAMTDEITQETPRLVAPDSPKADLNDATVEELRVIDGVGFVRALEIVEYRERYGHYRRIEELGMIPGIGAKTLHVLAERFEVRGQFSTHKG